ncbi:MAG: hypothetical protein EOO29_26845 [Comamonadaceae bacterium]|nr:MAG: hypothetical protein EOO29_26845 [Comamonadaceae bacterium]
MTIRPSTLTITLVGDARGNVSVRTDLSAPRVGAAVTPVQSLGMDLIQLCVHKGHDIVRGIAHVPALAFAHDVSCPDQYGWAVSREVVTVAAGIVALSQRSTEAA